MLKNYLSALTEYNLDGISYLRMFFFTKQREFWRLVLPGFQNNKKINKFLRNSTSFLDAAKIFVYISPYTNSLGVT